MRLGQLVIDTAPARANARFRLVLLSRAVVLLAAGLIGVAVSYQIYALTRSSLQVALINVVLAGSLVLGFLVGGVLADRMERRRLIVSSSAAVVIAFAVFAVNAAIASPYQLTVIYLTTAVGAAVEGVGETALTAVTPSLVDREQLAAASGLIAVTSQLGAIAGPALGGVLIGGAGLVANYALAGLAMLVTTALLTRLPSLAPGSTDGGADPAPPTSAGRSIVEGLSFVRRNPLIAGVLLIDLCATVFGVPAALFPQFAAEVFRGGPEVLGTLSAAPAVGAFLASVTSGWTGRVRRSGSVLVTAVAVLGGAYIGFGLSTHLAAALVFLALIGAVDTVSEILRRALLQFHTPEPLQGRVNSLWLAQANASHSIGAVAAGLAARVLGPGGAIMAAGALCIAGVLALTATLPALRRATLRPDGDPAPAGDVAQTTAPR